MITSELSSQGVEQARQLLGGAQFYYFFHGWAALDWYRGYDKTFLMQPVDERTVRKTFISPNRIIGGERLHRVAMLYHFAKNDLWHNHISAPRICPVENLDIVDIATRLVGPYPDILHVLKDAPLPKMFSGETTQEMHSCWLSLFKESSESLVYHVTETVAQGQRLHLTEKIFKPICLQMPFVLTGTKGSLEYLRQYGFQTFNGLWDESYDQIEDDFERYTAVAKVLSKLDKLSYGEKQALFRDCIPIIKHNFNHFYNGGFERILWDELTTMLRQIDDYFSN